MKQFIPPLKTQLEVMNFWKISLIDEYRNRTLWAHLDQHDEFIYKDHMLPHCRDMAKSVVILPGSKLKVSRIYIRKGSEGHSSVTVFGQVYIAPKTCVSCRFWVTLDDWNTLNAQVI